MAVTGNIFLYKDYKYTKSNHNISTSRIIDLVFDSIRKINTLGEIQTKEDLVVFHNFLRDLETNNNLLKFSLNGSTFTSDSIDKKRFERLVIILNEFLFLANLVDQEMAIDIKKQLIIISNTLSKVNVSYKQEGPLGTYKIVVVFDDNRWNQFENEVIKMENYIKLIIKN